MRSPAYRAGRTIKAVAERLGHSSPVVPLVTYAHILPGIEEQLNERLDAAFSATAAALPPEVASEP